MAITFDKDFRILQSRLLLAYTLYTQPSFSQPLSCSLDQELMLEQSWKLLASSVYENQLANFCFVFVFDYQEKNYLISETSPFKESLNQAKIGALKHIPMYLTTNPLIQLIQGQPWVTVGIFIAKVAKLKITFCLFGVYLITFTKENMFYKMINEFLIVASKFSL